MSKPFEWKTQGHWMEKPEPEHPGSFMEVAESILNESLANHAMVTGIDVTILSYLITMARKGEVQS